jgi:hypothetical protein
VTGMLSGENEMLWDTMRNSRLPRLHKEAAQLSCLSKRVVTTHGHILINILTAHTYLHDPRTSTSATVATLRLLDILPNLLFPLRIRFKPLVPIFHPLLKIWHLVRTRVTRHQLWLSQRQFVAAICLPQVVDFTVEMDDFFHFPVLCEFPGGFWDGGWLGHDQHPGLYFKDVGVPEFLFFRVKSVVELGSDHVLCAQLVVERESG